MNANTFVDDMAPHTDSDSKPTRRQQRLLQFVRARGFVSVQELSHQYGVTTQTIRRDLDSLCAAKLLKRFHGGVSSGDSSVENVPYGERRISERAAKAAIAKLVASHISDRSSLFIDLGTTNDSVARALMSHRALHVITNNLNAALTMSANESFRIIVAGGLVRHGDHGTTGQLPIELIRHFKVDYAIIGISGIDLDGTLRDFDFDEIHVAQVMMQNARHVWLVADHTKVGRPALVRLSTVSALHAWFTDEALPEELSRIAADAGVQVHIASAEPSNYP